MDLGRDGVNGSNLGVGPIKRNPSFIFAGHVMWARQLCRDGEDIEVEAYISDGSRIRVSKLNVGSKPEDSSAVAVYAIGENPRSKQIQRIHARGGDKSQM